MAQHPTNGKRVHVVNAAYCDQLEKENDELGSKITKLHQQLLFLERECVNNQNRWVRFSRARMEKDILVFDPVSGDLAIETFSAEEYRQHHGLVAWLYNPWTGEPRDPRDIGSDVQGLLIEP